MSLRTQQAEGRRFLAQFSWVVGGLGLACLVFAVWHAWQIGRTASWPRVDAIVTRLSVTYQTNIQAHNKWRQISVSEHIDFSYEYVVEGRRFESSRFFFLRPYPAGFELQRRFQPGPHFQALLDPGDPSVAIVEPGPVNHTAFVVGVGMLMVWGLAFAARLREAQTRKVCNH